VLFFCDDEVESDGRKGVSVFGGVANGVSNKISQATDADREWPTLLHHSPSIKPILCLSFTNNESFPWAKYQLSLPLVLLKDLNIHRQVPDLVTWVNLHPNRWMILWQSCISKVTLPSMGQKFCSFSARS